MLSVDLALPVQQLVRSLKIFLAPQEATKPEGVNN